MRKKNFNSRAYSGTSPPAADEPLREITVTHIWHLGSLLRTADHRESGIFFRVIGAPWDPRFFSLSHARFANDISLTRDVVVDLVAETRLRSRKPTARSARASSPDSDLPRGSRLSRERQALSLSTAWYPWSRRGSSPTAPAGLLLIKLSCGTHAAAAVAAAAIDSLRLRLYRHTVYINDARAERHVIHHSDVYRVFQTT